MSPIMANFKDGSDHKDRYFETNKKNLSQDKEHCIVEALIIIFKKFWPMSFFLIILITDRRSYIYHKQ